MTLFAVKNLEVRYGGVKAVKKIDFHLEAGEVVALIGANGAGKSSTLRAICGQPSSGEILFAGKNLREVAPHDLVREGIAMVPEGRGIFGRSSVEENLQIGAYSRRDREIHADIEKIYALFPRLKERRTQAAGTLSGGEQQMLSMGRALMSRPKLLLLDEPSMGLAPLMVEKIFDTVREIASGGMTILLVEQNAALALELSTRGYVMESGRIVAEDSAQALLENPMVREAYLGH